MTLRIPGRVVFIIPWPRPLDHRHDRPPGPRPARPLPRPSAEDVDEILSTVNRQLDIDLGAGDIVGTYAGHATAGRRSAAARPSRPRGSTAWRPSQRAGSRSRGGKYTTYRVMARDVGRRRRWARERPGAAVAGRRSCRWSARRRRRAGADRSTLERPLREAAGCCGDAARDVAGPDCDVGSPTATAARRPRSWRSGASSISLRRSATASITSQAEVAWAARRELALTLDDVLARRMRLAQELPDRGAVDRAGRRGDAGRGARLGPGARGGRGRSVSRDRAARIRRCRGRALRCRRRPLILALDQGTTSSRAIAFGRDGRPVASAQKRIPATVPVAGPRDPRPGGRSGRRSWRSRGT